MQMEPFMFRHEVYSPSEIAVIHEAVDIVLEDAKTTETSSLKVREKIALKAFRVAAEQEAIDLDTLVTLLRTDVARTGAAA
jgi:hypothetical protein